MIRQRFGWLHVIAACALGFGCESGGDDASGSGGATGSGGAIAQGGASSAHGGTEHPATGGRSGSGGNATGGASEHAGGTSSSGGKPAKCDIPECLRAVECVAECGGPVLSASCCACPTGQRDRVTQCGASTANGGAGGVGGADSSEDGEAAGSASLDNSLTDPSASGSGACASKTVAALITSIHDAYPELADITRLYDPNQAGDGSQIYVFRAGHGFRFVFVRGAGDCPAGCIDHEYWYFETNASCAIERVGHYTRRFFSTGNCFELIGTPLWGVPAASHDTGCGLNLDLLNSACSADQCPAPLTPVFYYGIAGTAGPKFCSCSIPCAKDPSVCPTGSQCSTIADGPGTVCSAP